MGFWWWQAAIATNELTLGPPVPRFGYRHPIGIGIQLARNLGAHRLRSRIFWRGIAVFVKKRGVRQLSGSTQKWDFREKNLSVRFFVWMVRSDEKMFWGISKFCASCKLNGIHSANFVRQQCQALQHHVAPIFRTRTKSKIFLSGSPFGVRPSRYHFF